MFEQERSSAHRHQQGEEAEGHVTSRQKQREVEPMQAKSPFVQNVERTIEAQEGSNQQQRPELKMFCIHLVLLATGQRGAGGVQIGPGQAFCQGLHEALLGVIMICHLDAIGHRAAQHKVTCRNKLLADVEALFSAPSTRLRLVTPNPNGGPGEAISSNFSVLEGTGNRGDSFSTLVL